MTHCLAASGVPPGDFRGLAHLPGWLRLIVLISQRQRQLPWWHNLSERWQWVYVLLQDHRKHDSGSGTRLMLRLTLTLMSFMHYGHQLLKLYRIGEIKCFCHVSTLDFPAAAIEGHDYLRTYAYAGPGVLYSSALAQAPAQVLLARLVHSVSSVASRTPCPK